MSIARTDQAKNPALILDRFDSMTPDRIYQATTQWLSLHFWEILIAAVIGTAIFLAFGGLKRLAKRQLARNDSMVGFRTTFLRAAARTSRLFMLAVSARLVIAYANAPELVASTIGFFFTIMSVWQVAIWAREIILGLIERRTMLDDRSETLENAMTLIRILVSFAVFAIAAIVILDNLGFNVTGLIAGLGVGGIAIGLAAQGIFSDLFAALSIIFDQPFKRGETITFDNITGTIEKIGLKSTRLRALTGEEIIISNTNLLNKEISNMTRLVRRRTRFKIGVIYQTKPEEARRIPDLLQEIVERHDGTFIRSGFIGFGDSSIDFELDFDIESSDFEVVFQGRHAIGLEILERFNAEGLEFAYPTQTTFTAAPDGEMILPFPQVMPVVDAASAKAKPA